MKKIQNVLVGLFIVALSVLPVQAQAEVIAQPTIAVLDMQAILIKSAASKSIKAQFEKQQDKYQAEITKQTDKLQAEEKKLNEERPNLKPEEFAEKSKAFQQQIVNTQKITVERRQSLDKALGTAMQTLRGEVAQIVADIAQKENITLVLSRQNVVLAEKSMDITAPVLAKLDDKLKTVPLKWSK